MLFDKLKLVLILACLTGCAMDEFSLASSLSPSEPTYFTPTAVTSTAVQLSWLNSLHPAFEAGEISYEICYDTSSSACQDSFVANAAVTGSTQTTITGLNKNTDYYVRIRAKDLNNNISSSVALSSTMVTTNNWAQLLGTSDFDYANGVATDPSGNVYITGSMDGGLDLHGFNRHSDIFVTKFDSTGAKQWTQMLGTSSNDEAYGVVTDSSGNVYITGETSGTLTNSENVTNAGGSDIFVTKYDSAGNRQWTRMLGTTSSDRARGIAIDSSDNIYITGFTAGTLTNVGGHTNVGGFSDIFVTKYDSAGNFEWTQMLGTSSNDEAYGVVTDPSGNVYITGHTYGTLTNAGGHTNAGFSDIFVIKYDSTGARQWTQMPGTSRDDFARGVATDPGGNVYITGYTLGNLDGQTNQGVYDIFVTKYDAIGAKQWTKMLGTSLYDYAYGVATDPSGNVYITGKTDSNLDGQKFEGIWDTFVTKYNSAGARQWTRMLGTPYTDQARGVATDSSSYIYITGYARGNLDEETNAGEYDIFVIKYDSAGNR